MYVTVTVMSNCENNLSIGIFCKPETVSRLVSQINELVNAVRGDE